MNNEEQLKKLKDLLEIERTRKDLYLKDWDRAVHSNKSSISKDKARDDFYAQDGVVKGIELAIQEIE